jgi:hypothetical protein
LGDGSGTIVKPDYLKKEQDVFLELAVRLIQQYGFRVLSPVEHDDRTLNEDFPSWVPFRWNVEYTMCTFGVHSDFYYDASASTERRPPAVVGNNYLKVRGLTVDVVSEAYQFSASDLENPAKFKSSQPADPQRGTLDRIWTDVQDAGTASVYPWEDRLSAFSLTLCAGLSTYASAEENIAQHHDNFAAYWRLRAQSSTLGGELLADLQGGGPKGRLGKILVRHEAGLRRAELSVYTKRLLRPRTVHRKTWRYMLRPLWRDSTLHFPQS